MDPVTAQTELPPADPTAVVGRRILAWVIDAVIIGVIAVVLFVNMASSQELGSSFEAELTCDLLNNGGSASNYVCINSDTTVILIEDGDLVLLLAVIGIYSLVTQLILPSITGFSPGKAMVGLRIVNQDTFETAGFVPNLVRWLLWIVDSAPWCLPLVGFITGLASKGHRRVGDMAASTLVIDKKWVGRPLPVPGVNTTAPVGMVAPAGAPGVAAPPFSPPPPPGGATTPPPPSGFPASPPAPTSPPAPPMTPPAAAPPVAPPATPPAPAPAPAPPTPEPAPPEPFSPAAEPPTTETPITEPPADATVAFPVVDAETPAEPAPATPSASDPPPPPAPAPAPEPPQPAPRPGIDAPQWDPARDTYIQWDPELSEWMEWSETQGSWIPISR